MRNSMKVVILGIVFGLFFYVGNLQAHERHYKMNTEKYLAKLTKKFDLTKDQQDQIKKLMVDKKQKMEEIRRSYHDQFRSVLTDDQRKKWDADEEKEKEEKETEKK